MKYLIALILLWTFTAAAQEELPMDPNARDIQTAKKLVELSYQNVGLQAPSSAA